MHRLWFKCVIKDIRDYFEKDEKYKHEYNDHFQISCLLMNLFKIFKQEVKSFLYR